MWQMDDVIVISDLHLATKKGDEGETSQELFQADDLLEQFLTWILKDTRKTLVVLNGDVLDYLSIPPNPESRTAVLTLSQLSERTSAIVEGHSNLFDALARLAQSQHHQVALTSGNHDPELMFPDVQRVMERRLGGARHSRPIQWLVQGEALELRIGGARTLIEHGDVLDAWNRVDRSALRSAVSLGSRGLLNHHKYNPPPGSRLVLDCLLSLKKD